MDDDKRAAARAAVGEVAAGMLVGLGTGSTAAHAIAALAERVRGGLRVEAVVTSLASERLAVEQGIIVRPFADVAAVDLTIDGVDEIDPTFRAIKGAGGAMLREKAVAQASRRMVAIADASKRVAAIGDAKLPVEVMPFARAAVLARLAALFGRVTVRDAPTDNGNLVADGHEPVTRDWPALAAALSAIPGVVGHGLFLDEVDALYVADGGIVTRVERSSGSG